LKALVLGLIVLLIAGTAGAQELRLEGALIQGGLIQGFIEPGAEVLFEGRPVRVSDAGQFLIGFGRDDIGPFELEVRHPSGIITRRSLTIEARQYDIQRIDGLPQNMVSPDPDTLDRIQSEGAVIASARARDTPEPLFAGGFVWPAIGPISGVYGSQRILNGEPKRPHFGVDVAGPVGTPVTAPAVGIVVLAEDDLYYTGGTVMLDHGHGLTSIFLHMSLVTVRLDERVAQGDLIGRIGATGRATGPHLDWRLNLFKTRLDPQLLVGPMPGGQ
jgi:murein DD-endopeptidase MepM/ murein hydrolase activator NlpD